MAGDVNPDRVEFSFEQKTGHSPMNWFKSIWKRLMAPDSPHVYVQSRSLPVPSAEPWSTFTPRAQQVLALAREEANRMHHNVIGTEHLLLGLIALGGGVAVNVMRRMGLDLESVRTEVQKTVGPGPADESSGKVPYTPRVKKALDLARREAKALNHTCVGTEHIFLGLLAEGEGVAARILKEFGVDREITRQEVLRELDPNFIPAEAAPGTSPSPTTSKPTESAAGPRVISPQPQGEPVDTGKRYDVYCNDGSERTIIYRNARFKGSKHLFQRSQHDTLSTFVELEQADGQIVFIARRTIIRFCEPGVTPAAEGEAGKKE